MLELGRKERNLMGGLGFQILFVCFLVFAYTQAIRQVKLNKALSLRLQEQLTVAREQVAHQGGKFEEAALRAQLAELESSLAPQGSLGTQAQRLERLAQERFGIRNADVKAAEAPSENISVPLEGQPDFQAHLYSLEMKGTAGSRRVAALLEDVSDPSFKPLCPLVAMDLKGANSAGNQPVEFTLKWMMAVSPDSSTAAPLETLPPPGRSVDWGWREEPFLSAFIHPNALRIPADKLSPFRLEGIVHEGTSGPACIVNGEVFKPGDWLKGYQLVLITPTAVLLEGKGEEIILRLP